MSKVEGGIPKASTPLNLTRYSQLSITACKTFTLILKRRWWMIRFCAV